MEDAESSDEEIVYIGKARCIIPFSSTNEVELELKVGDVVDLTRKDVGGGWWEGELNGVLGLFPQKYVQELNEAPAPPVAASTLSGEAPASSGGDGGANPFLTTATAPVQRQPQQVPQQPQQVPQQPPPQQQQQQQQQQGGEKSPARPVTLTIPVSPPEQQQQQQSPQPTSDHPAAGKKGPIQHSVTYQPPPSISRFAATPGTEPTIMHGCKWAKGTPPNRYLIRANEEKGKKFSGMKSFTTYDILTESSGVSVQRRFKHFTWLAEQLHRIYPFVTIPPLPEKHYSGRFASDFIEQRRSGLEKFIERVAVHPILGTSSVWKHFVSAVDYKDWKTGKRLAEQQKPFLSIVTMYEGARTAAGTQEELESLIEQSTNFVIWIQRRLTSWNVAGETMGHHFGDLVESFKKMSDEVKKFDEIFGEHKFSTWWSKESVCPINQLAGSLQELSTAFEHVAIMSEQHNQVQMGTLVSSLHEYSALVKNIPVVAQHGKWKETPEFTSNGMLVCNVILSEFRHFHEMLVSDLKRIVETFIQQQVAYHQQVAATWSNLLPAFAEEK